VGALELPLLALRLPGGGERAERGDVPGVVVGLLVGQGGADLAGHRTREHVQDLVAVVAGVQEPPGGLVDLGRVVVGELLRDDLVHREVQADVHRLAGDDDVLAAVGERLVELGMVGADRDRSRVRVGEVLDLETGGGKGLRACDQRQAGPGVVVEFGHAWPYRLSAGGPSLALLSIAIRVGRRRCRSRSAASPAWKSSPCPAAAAAVLARVRSRTAWA
jgi:hypothetical protein